MKKSLLLTSIILCAASGSFADEQIAEANLAFQSIDLNADGYISMEEAVNEETLINQFSILDTDEDGMLSEAEFGNLTEATN